LADAQD